MEGEETRGKEKKRQLKISENQQVGPKKRNPKKKANIDADKTRK